MACPLGSFHRFLSDVAVHGIDTLDRCAYLSSATRESFREQDARGAGLTETPMPDLQAVREALSQFGQEHLLRFFDALRPPRQAALLEQLAAIDFPQLRKLIDQYVLGGPESAPGGKIDPLPAVSARDSDPAVQAELQDARRCGDELLKAGKVAAFVVAGGQGTRLGYEGPKGCLEATPVTNKPLFAVFAEQILAASRRHGVAIPWYVMTSPTNDVATQAFFRQHDSFGLNSDDVFFLRQGTMPAIGFDGRLLLASRDRLAVNPDGHGGSLQALRQSGALEDMERRGVELISYFQVDNPLVRCVDPLFLGLHDLRGVEMSAKALPKRDPMEKLGNFCRVDGKATIIEYSDLPEELARATGADGRLRFSAGSIAVHVLGREFVERLTAGGHTQLPFHRAEKKVSCVDDAGEAVSPDEPNAVKLEMFVFDAMPLANDVVILETNRREEFSPIKNAEGPDSLQTSLHDQVRRSAAWLEAAGVTIPRDADGQIASPIEISPLFADSAEELARKMDAAPTIVPGEKVCLQA